MYYDYDFDIEQANISSEDKKLLKEFLELLKSFDAVGKDSQNWQAKFQYLMNL